MLETHPEDRVGEWTGREDSILSALREEGVGDGNVNAARDVDTGTRAVRSGAGDSLEDETCFGGVYGKVYVKGDDGVSPVERIDFG